MLAVILLVASLYLPVLSAPQPAEPPSPVDPAVVKYVTDVQALGGAYLSVVSGLSDGLAALAGNPLLIRDPAFINSIRQLSATIRFLRFRLDATPSPAPVEEIHRNLERAGDLFVLASFELDRFAERHNFGDVADAYELITAGTALWIVTLQDLPSLPGEVTGQSAVP